LNRCWGDMDSETRCLWEKLGWCGNTWDTGRKNAQVAAWAGLSDDIRATAQTLGYDSRLWDTEDRTVPRKPKKTPGGALHDYNWGFHSSDNPETR